jgi:tryptophanyl-tRNA synthetase
MYADLLHFATIGHLSRMTQYKEKSEKENQSAALLVYPVLMAADIFHLNGSHIPVGNDQVQHIEFIRDLYDKLSVPKFPKPEAVISEYPRIMSLKDGTKKMSKSDPDDDNRINLSDSPETIQRKIMKARTALSINDDTPEMHNLKSIYKAFGGVSSHERLKEFKKELIELIINELCNKDKL